MKKARKINKKGWAAVIAVALIAAIVLTGTLSWLSVSQEAVNEFKRDKNPGGRIHDDFNGVENKDVYAENFTDEEFGAPVYVRVRLEEYMETGDEAGVNRDDPDRKAKSLVEGADINDTSTWFVHKPDSEEEGAVKDPFHKYWTWHMGGETVYMPTFNKNKDSLSVDVNGTYLGNNGVFDDLDPYSDYKTYTVGDDVTAWAYYDADPEDEDEYQGRPGEVPGGGGVEVTDETPDGNYTKEEETHTAQSTLAGLGVITMEEWKTAGMPVCNKWVWDDDGWFYWPEPVQPQTATGLLLNKVVEKNSAGDKCYYAVNVKGQFVDGNPDAWGAPTQYQLDEDGQKVLDPVTGEPIVTAAATGFFLDGFSQDAQKLVAQAQSVKVVKDDETGEKTWYLPFGVDTNLYHTIQDDEGTLGALVCAGIDETIGTEDDRADIVYVAEEVKVGETPYGNYFLKPRTADPYYEPYYLAMGPDKMLGTGDDPRLWIPDGATFPDGVTDTLADSIEITTTTGAAEVEVGKTLTFSAAVSLDGAPVDEDVIWSVAPAPRMPLAEGTSINETTGLLTVADDEPNPQLIVTAALKRDNRNVNTFTVDVLGKPYVDITLADGTVLTEVQAGKTVDLKATVCQNGEPVTTQPESFTWSATNTPAASTLSLRDVTPNVDAVQMNNGLLTVGRALNGTVTVTAECTVDGETRTGTLELDVTPAEAVTVTLSGGGSGIEPGDTTGVTFTASLTHTDELEDTGVDWQVGKSSDDGETIETITGVTITDGALTLPADYSIDTNGSTLWVKATAKDSTAGGAGDKASIDVIAPFSIEVGGASKVRLGSAGAMTATVKKADGTEYGSDQVNWTVAPKDSTITLQEGTRIDAEGVLHVAGGEAITTLVVTATSKVKKDVVGTKEVETNYDPINVIGTEVTIDDIKYIVLTKDAATGETLLLLKTPTAQRVWGNEKWFRSGPRGYCGSFANDKPELKAMLDKVDTKQIYARDVFDGHTCGEPTQDKVFLLSESDIAGLREGDTLEEMGKEFTAGAQLSWPTEKWGCAGKSWWNRSARGNSGSNGTIAPNGAAASAGTANDTIWVRPALWIKTSDLPAESPLS